MSINPKYMLMPTLQQVFFNKDDGLFLANGKVKFYKDKARDFPKQVYVLTGTPPDYEYISIGSEITLNTIGAYADESGNPILPLLYPYDTNGNVELYYIVIEDESGSQQYAYSGIPLLAISNDEDIQFENFVPNGQFLLHNYISKNDEVGTAGIVDIAYGGWTFERPDGTSSIDLVRFERYGSPVTIPKGFPRYSGRFTCEIPNTGDNYKRIALIFNDVNKFASDTQYYTFSFYAKAISSPVEIYVYALKHYGSGGDADVETEHTTPYQITTSGGMINAPILFGSNEGKTIGTNDDDYVKIIIDLPSKFAFDFRITDCSLVLGNQSIDTFPFETEREVIYKSLAGSIEFPKYDGSSIGLPLMLTSTGIMYDYGHVGRKYDLGRPYNATLDWNMLKADGTSYDIEERSSQGIPYKRLRDVIGDIGTHKMPRYGTGTDRCSAFINTDILLTINRPNSWSGVTGGNAEDGSIPTTFVFANSTLISDHKSTLITVKVGADITAGSYWKFYDASNRIYIVWYKKDGSGTKPSTTGYRYIEVDILSTDTIKQVKEKTVITINYQYFAVPDWQGAFFRMIDGTRGLDPDKASRGDGADYDLGGANLFGTSGNNVGSYQGDVFGYHTHYVQHGNLGNHLLPVSYGGGSGADQHGPQDTNGAGGNETRPRNYYIDCAIGF